MQINASHHVRSQVFKYYRLEAMTTLRRSLIIIALATLAGAFAVHLENAAVYAQVIQNTKTQSDDPRQREQDSTQLMKLPKLWRYEVERFENCRPGAEQSALGARTMKGFACGEPYVVCSYETEVCQGGYRSHVLEGDIRIFLFEMFAHDRSPTLAHLLCQDDEETEGCLSFDTGQVQITNRKLGIVVREFDVSDLGDECVDFARDPSERLQECNALFAKKLPRLLQPMADFPSHHAAALTH